MALLLLVPEVQAQSRRARQRGAEGGYGMRVEKKVDSEVTGSETFRRDKLLAVSDDDSLMGDYMTSFNASTLLQDLTYSMSYTAYSYVTFARNHFVIDPYRVFSGYESFYPGAMSPRTPGPHGRTRVRRFTCPHRALC